eukprot:gnl/Dysnectes_brevis/5943_a8856_491.p1 GENE.gnl/Dysnectes_brevis/5943_a8856_491~~gnl/Dysnectes_brevis/5943_a8856_491.p1  ORF type:complete len:458 (-),score=30.77 gnl/Dysnectes_brevis/5943_a8856_491:22-1395(-)
MSSDSSDNLNVFLQNFITIYKFEMRKLKLLDYRVSHEFKYPKPPSTLPRRPFIIRGWLSKEGGSRKTWRKRYAVMSASDDYRIEYFTDQKCTKLKGTILPGGMTPRHEKQPGRPHTMLLEHPGSRSWSLDLRTEQDRRRWHRALSAACDRAEFPLGVSGYYPALYRAADRAFQRLRVELGTDRGPAPRTSVPHILRELLGPLPPDFSMEATQMSLSAADVELGTQSLESLLVVPEDQKEHITTRVSECKPLITAIFELIQPMIREQLSIFLSQWSIRCSQMLNALKSEGAGSLAQRAEGATSYFQWPRWGGLKSSYDAIDRIDASLSRIEGLDTRERREKVLRRLPDELQHLASNANASLVGHSLKHKALHTDIGAALHHAREEAQSLLLSSVRVAYPRLVCECVVGLSDRRLRRGLGLRHGKNDMEGWLALDTFDIVLKMLAPIDTNLVCDTTLLT